MEWPPRSLNCEAIISLVSIEVLVTLTRHAVSRSTVVLSALALLILTAPAFAQMNTADIAGIVTDPSGAVVPGATVVSVNVATQAKAASSTNDAGQYVLAELPLGEYSL